MPSIIFRYISVDHDIEIVTRTIEMPDVETSMVPSASAPRTLASAPGAGPASVAPSVAPPPAQGSAPAMPMPPLAPSIQTGPALAVPGLTGPGIPTFAQLGRMPSTGGPRLPLEILFPFLLVGTGMVLRRRGRR
jgi:hypothetical protein